MQEIRVLQGVAGVEQNDPRVARQVAALEQTAERRNQRSTFRTGQDALAAGQFGHGRDQFVVAYGDRRSVRLANRSQHEGVGEGQRHPQPGGRCVRIDRPLGRRRPRLPGIDHGPASVGLYGNQPWGRAFQPAQLVELAHGLPDGDEPYAAARGVEHGIRRLPVEGFGDLEPHGLLALHAVGLAHGGGVEPAVPCRALADQAPRIADQAVNLGDLGAVGPALRLDG